MPAEQEERWTLETRDGKWTVRDASPSPTTFGARVTVVRRDRALSAESRVQELERERDERKALYDELVEAKAREVRIMEQRAVAAESHLARLEERVRELEQRLATEGLPDDLLAVLRDPSIVVANSKVFELIAEWQNAPSNTASGSSTPPSMGEQDSPNDWPDP